MFFSFSCEDCKSFVIPWTEVLSEIKLLFAVSPTSETVIFSVEFESFKSPFLIFQTSSSWTGIISSLITSLTIGGSLSKSFNSFIEGITKVSLASPLIS